ncbi:hypothetical protein [Methylobacterium brachiatum]|nr:hypothetical protein [Methylobacterium brachiatum]
MREVALLIIGQPVSQGVHNAMTECDGEQADEDVLRALRTAMRTAD